MKTFSDLGLAEPLLRAITREGYETPTPIQSEAIPVMTAGSDLIGIAQTGTGKTAAFVLPLLESVAKAQSDRGFRGPAPKTCSALIVVPTRELAAQVAASVRTYGRFIRPDSTVIVGGARHGPQIKALSQGMDIVIATPGRLEDHIRSGHLRLDKTSTIVLDEADQMLDLGFIPAIRRILSLMPAERQTVLLSATMPPAIRDLAKAFLNAPVEVRVTPDSRPVDAIDQQIKFISSDAKRAALVELLQESDVERAIVFTRTKHGADKVCQHLERAGLRAAAIHGNKSQGQRERALRSFKVSRVKVLVATDIAARGIDIDNVSHVVNFELPNMPEAYVHRIGRTARAGKSGVAISFCDPGERNYLRDIERLIGRSLVTGEPITHAPRRSKRPGNKKPFSGNHRPGQHAKSRNPKRRSGNQSGHAAAGSRPKRSEGGAAHAAKF